MTEMVKQTAIRIPADLEAFAQTVCRIERISMNALVTRALNLHFSTLRDDPSFRKNARRVLEEEIGQLRSIAE